MIVAVSTTTIIVLVAQLLQNPFEMIRTHQVGHFRPRRSQQRLDSRSVSDGARIDRIGIEIVNRGAQIRNIAIGWQIEKDADIAKLQTGIDQDTFDYFRVVDAARRPS